MPPPPRHPLGHAPELVGPADEKGRREDVSGHTERSLVLRALDGILHVAQDMRLLKLGLRLELDDHDGRIRLLEGGPSMRPPPAIVPGSYRDPDASSHDWSAQLAEADRILRLRVKDQGDRGMTSDRARAIALEVVKAATDGEELSTWRRIKALGPKLAWEGLKATVPLIVGGVAVYIWHLLHR